MTLRSWFKAKSLQQRKLQKFGLLRNTALFLLVLRDNFHERKIIFIKI